MIRLIEPKDVQEVLKLYCQNNTDTTKEHIESLIGNMTEYIYVSYDNEKLNGLISCYNDGTNIYIKRLIANAPQKK